MISAVELGRRGSLLIVTWADGRRSEVPVKRLGGPRGARLLSAAVSPGYHKVALAFGDGSTRELGIDAPPFAPASDATPCDLIVTGAGQILTMAGQAQGREGRLGRLTGAGPFALAVRQGTLAWMGRAADLAGAVEIAKDAQIVDAAGGLVTPGLVEPHAHPIFAGSRASEFAARAAGASYLEIAEKGGGIAATVRATRLALEAPRGDGDGALLASTLARLQRLCAWGVTTCEAKTGYALTPDGELALLELLAEAHALGPVDLSPTLLAAHAIPLESRGDAAARAAYVAAAAALPARARGLAESVDIYCDAGAFTLEEARLICAGARAAGLPVRMHADQIAAIGASQLAAEVGALSVDHLEHLPLEVIPALARAGTVAVLLPGATLNLGLPLPPARRLLDAGVPVALGTDLNPGSSMTEALPLQLWLACTQLGMTVDEAWLGVTVSAARALGHPSAGRLALGGPADLVLWNAEAPEEVPYRYGANLVRVVIKDGQVIAFP